MAAGLGFKDFVTGEVLTANDVDGYLMQGVWVFASAAARDAAVTSPQEGNFAYLKDTNVTTYYTGSAWANLDTTGMTNPMTTTGDTIYSSSGSTPARLGIGTTGQVLTVAGGIPSWATATSAGSMTLLSTTTLSTSSVTISSIDQTYETLRVVVFGVTNATGASDMYIAPNGSTTESFLNANYRNGANNEVGSTTSGKYMMIYGSALDRTNSENAFLIEFDNYADTDKRKTTRMTYGYKRTSDSAKNYGSAMGYVDFNTAISSLTISNNNAYSFSSGTVLVYGVK